MLFVLRFPLQKHREHFDQKEIISVVQALIFLSLDYLPIKSLNRLTLLHLKHGQLLLYQLRFGALLPYVKYLQEIEHLFSYHLNWFSDFLKLYIRSMFPILDKKDTAHSILGSPVHRKSIDIRF